MHYGYDLIEKFIIGIPSLKEKLVILLRQLECAYVSVKNKLFKFPAMTF